MRSTDSALFVIDEQAVADAVSWEPRPVTPSPPVVKDEPPAPTVLDLPTEPPTPTPEILDVPAEVSKAVVSSPVPSSILPFADHTDGEMSLPLVAIAGGVFAAFAVGTFAMRGRTDVQDETSSVLSSKIDLGTPAPPAESLSSFDISVPYDAAARIEYDKWRAVYGKGGFDEEKFKRFKAQYNAITSMNMAAKKVARDTGTAPNIQAMPADSDE